MAITPQSLVRHELVGLAVSVVESTNPDLVGLAGTVVGETTNTLRVEGDDRVRTVPKAAATLAFELPDGERVTVEGARLVARPARRTQTAGGSIWHSD
ncbi:MAG: ribonuclease P protein component 1 [Halobacteriales archaeon]|nr:ribonuclease P protein component 1 [Halobacteriales archaeon]